MASLERAMRQEREEARKRTQERKRERDTAYKQLLFSSIITQNHTVQHHMFFAYCSSRRQRGILAAHHTRLPPLCLRGKKGREMNFGTTCAVPTYFTESESWTKWWMSANMSCVVLQKYFDREFLAFGIKLAVLVR